MLFWFRKQDVPYNNHLSLPPGAYTLKLVAAEEGGREGSAEQTLTVPPLPASGWAMSSLIVSQDLQPLPGLIRNIHTRLLNDSDPLLFIGYRIYVPVSTEVSKQRPMVIFYRLYSVSEKDSPAPTAVVPALTDQKGAVRHFPPINLVGQAVIAGRREFAVGFKWSANDLPTGKYRLAVETSFQSAPPVVSAPIDLEVR